MIYSLIVGEIFLDLKFNKTVVKSN
jgi:hypothetical protein